VRTRIKNTFTATPSYQEISHFASCSAVDTVVGNTGTVFVGAMDKCIDEVIPGFYARRKKGEVFFNSFSLIHDKQTLIEGGGWTLTTKNPTCASPLKFGTDSIANGSTAALCRLSPYASSGYVNLVGASAFDQRELQSAIAEVSTGVLAQVGRSSHTNYYESVAEREQVFSLIRKPLAGLSKIAKSLRSGGTTKAVASQWLQYRYGILPLMSDISNTIRVVREDFNNRNTERARSQLSLSSSVTSTVTAGVFSCPLTYAYSIKLNLRATALWESSHPLLTNGGFGTKELLTAPWELIPYSFVVDWFVNVGDFLSAYAPDPYSNVLGSCLVQRFEFVGRVMTGNLSISSSTYNLTSFPQAGTLKREYTEVSRGPLPGPQLTLRQNFGFDRFKRDLDAFALVSQRFKGAFTPRR
jgi:hypothetical protein